MIFKKNVAISVANYYAIYNATYHFRIFVKISTKKLLLFSLRCRKGNHMARVISIVNQKGGTGKSACTANLAVGLAQKT